MQLYTMWMGPSNIILSVKISFKKVPFRASLVAQWLRVRAPVWEDPTCRGVATEPVRLEHVLHNWRGHNSERPAYQKKKKKKKEKK